MGKDWYWSSRSSKRSSSSSSATTTISQAEPPPPPPPPSGCMCAVFHLFHFHPFHPFPTTAAVHHQQKSSPQDLPLPQAPRNSLEESHHLSTTQPSNIIEQEQHFKIPKKIQVMKTSEVDMCCSSMESPGTSAKTPTLVARLMGLDLLPPPSSNLSSPSCSSSSCISTPNLHLLSKHRNSTDCVIVDHSSPRTRSDLDYYHHRLSLQINTNNNKDEDLEMMRFSSSSSSSLLSKRNNHFDDNHNNNNNVSNGRTSSSSSSSSPSHLARQIVKQVKKNVMMNSGRKVGQDITNTIKQREPQLVTQIKLKKKLSSKPSSPSLDNHHDSNSSSFSPRLRFIETKNNSHKPPAAPPSPPPPPPPQQVEELPRVLIRPKEEGSLQQNQKSSSSVAKCTKKVNNEKFSSSSRLKKQEEPFIVRPTSPPTTRTGDIIIKNATKTHHKKTHPLSNNLLNNINTVVPNLFPIKTEASPPPTKINHNKKQSEVCDKSSPQQLSSSWSHHHSHRYKQEGIISTLATRDFSTNDIVQAKSTNQNNAYSSSSTTGEELAAAAAAESEHHGPEFQYITGILSRTFNKEEQHATTTGQRFFHDLEEHPILNSHVSTPENVKDCIFSMKQKLGLRWNRRLMFDLVDEVLMEVLRPIKSEEKSRLWFLHGRCCCYYQGTVEGLMERVWKRIGKFPCKRCEFLEDIDWLIESEDMEKVKVEVEEGLEEEGERLVAEIEGNIWNTLVHESLMVMVTAY